MSKPPRPRRISELLAEPGSALARLGDSAGRGAELRSAIARALPEDLRPHLSAVAVHDGVLMLTVGDPVWASRIRFHRDPCLAAARQRGEDVRDLRVRVRPDQASRGADR